MHLKRSLRTFSALSIAAIIGAAIGYTTTSALQSANGQPAAARHDVPQVDAIAEAVWRKISAKLDPSCLKPTGSQTFEEEIRKQKFIRDLYEAEMRLDSAPR